MSIGRTASAAAPTRLRLSLARSYPAAMLAFVAAITALRVLWLWVQPAGLYPDEAQYWFWSKHLAFGYYSKPPLVAWLIALTTGLFGDSEFAVRLSAPFLAAGAAIFVYAIGARLYDRRVGFWSAIAYRQPARSIGVGLCHLDRCAAGAVLGRRALRLYPGMRGRPLALVARRRNRRRARPAGKIRDGLLAAFGGRFRPAVPRRAPPSAAAARRHRHRHADLPAQSVVELAKRLRQLSAYLGQCRSQWPAAQSR